MHISLQKEFKEVAANSSRDRKPTNQESHISRALLSRIKQRSRQVNRQKWREGNLERKLGAPDSISRNVKKNKRGEFRNRRERVRAQEVSCRLHRGKERVSHFYFTLNNSERKMHNSTQPPKTQRISNGCGSFWISLSQMWMYGCQVSVTRQHSTLNNKHQRPVLF